MGCDIHMVVQYKAYSDSLAFETTIVPPLFERRCYSYFSMLAGVRGVEKSISDPKGLPQGVNLSGNGVLLFDVNGVIIDKWLGEHSYSYLSLKEIKKYYNKEFKRKKHYDENNKFYCEKLIEFMQCYSSDDDDDSVRIVFGFDS